ncbi:MAG: hypothetical protein IPL79_18040 [Myxococcales bacterium]|nr:hypothetical protein [Myxococcales bacterium]
MANSQRDRGHLVGEIIELAEAMIAQGVRRRNPMCSEQEIAASIGAWYGASPMPLAGGPGFRVRSLSAKSEKP